MMYKAAGVSLLSVVLASNALAQSAPPVEVLHWLTAGAESAAIQVLADGVEAKGGKWIDTAVPGGGADARAILLSRVAGGNPPNVVFLGIGPAGVELGEQGVMMDLAPLAQDGTWRAQLPDFAVDVGSTEGGQIFALPLALETQDMMWYSPPVYEAVGLELPTSWDEFVEQAPAIQDAGYIPLAVGAQAWQLSILFSSVVLGTGGTELYNGVFRDHDEAMAGGPGMVKALTVLRELSKYSDAGASNRAWNDTLNLVAEGKAAAQMMGSWAGAELINMGLEQGVTWDCATTPGSSAIIVGATGFQFPIVATEEAKAGQQLFIDVLMDPVVQAEFSALKGSIPARLDADVSGLNACSQLAAAKLQQPGGGVANLSGLTSSDGNGQFGDFLSNFWSNPDVTPEAAAAQIAAIVANEN